MARISSGSACPATIRLKTLEQENARLKRIVAEQALDISMLKDVARGNF